MNFKPRWNWDSRWRSSNKRVSISVMFTRRWNLHVCRESQGCWYLHNFSSLHMAWPVHMSALRWIKIEDKEVLLNLSVKTSNSRRHIP
jgi:hypothetical protein